MRITILDDYFNTLSNLGSFARLDDHDVRVWTDHVEDEDALAERLHDTQALVLFRERTAITRELIERLPGLELISMRGDHPHVDLEACSQNGIVLSSNVRGGASSHPTAELTWALIMASMRQIPRQMASLQAGMWQAGVGRSLRGQTLGLYGYGRIARTVATFAAPFGVDVVWWGSEEGRSRASADSVNLAPSREAFFSESDIVSLHVRLRADTREIITATDLNSMKPEALFVNTSRAALVEPGALLEALNRGRPGFAALDVYESEPVVGSSDPLVNHRNVVCTPHIGFVTEDELDRQFADVYDQVVAFADGNPINVINPSVLE